MRALVTGATGFVGRHLLPHLDKPKILSRPNSKNRADVLGEDVEVFDWSPTDTPPPQNALDGVDTVIHLAGESIQGRWNEAKKKRIEASRVVGTRNLVTAMRSAPQPPKLLIAASAVGYYGSQGDTILDEGAAPGDDFLARVGQRWEAEALAAADAGIRVVCLRFGVVLGAGGGALKEMLTPFKCGVGGRLGSGQQWMAWIALQDLVRLILFVGEQSALSGPVNATAPQPCKNSEFTKALGQQLGRPTLIPVPAPVLKFVLGEFATALLASQRVVPKAALDAGFQFQHPQISSALAHALKR